MKTAIKCVKKGKCFPNRFGKMLLSTLARKLTEGLSWLQKKTQATLILLREERTEGYRTGMGQDFSTELQDGHILIATRSLQECVYVTPSLSLVALPLAALR